MNSANLNLENNLLDSTYHFLPFRFMRFPSSQMLLVNEVGENIFINSSDFNKLISLKLDSGSETFLDLKSKHFIYDNKARLTPIVEMLATKYRTKKNHLQNFTTLHMVVTTLRCNHRCNYCHASSQDASAEKWDMSIDTARKVVEMIFKSPSKIIKIEFQGGESILNFDVVKEMVKYAKKLNKKEKKNLSFVLCTNLTLVDKNILQFLKENDVLISTSLDGPKHIHDANRVMRNEESSYDLFIEKLELTRSILGNDKVSALMTVTKSNIDNLDVVIDEYVRLGFKGIFLRSLNPFGYAKKESGRALQYELEDFIESYKRAIHHIFKINKEGNTFVEYFASILLSRILTPFSTGFMDLQSPAGAGILGVIYDYNGDVYPTDEGRMLAAAGDSHFKLGNIHHHSHEEIFGSDILKKIIKNSCVEIIPGCHSCAYQLFCGADPIRAYSEQNDKTYMGHMPSSEFCKKHKEIISFFFNQLEHDSESIDIFWSWLTKRDLKQVKLQ